MSQSDNRWIKTLAGARSVIGHLILPIGCAILILGAAPCQPQDSTSARIRKIVIYRNEIFGESDSANIGIVGRVVNAIHFLTKDRVIRAELLFREGDVYVPALLEESERNLRKMGIIGDVSVRALPADSGFVDVDVATHDKWTLNLNSSYKEDGGIRNFSLSLTEDNFLGNAQHVSAGYNYNSDRRDPNGMEFRLSEPRILDSRWAATFQYKKSEELQIKRGLIEHPFFSEDTPWATALYADEGVIRSRTFDGGKVQNETYLNQRHLNGWVTFSSGGELKRRISLAYVRVLTTGDRTFMTTFDNIDLISASFGVLHRTWYKGQFLNNFGRAEDVSLGQSANLIMGRNVSTRINPASWFVHLTGQCATGDANQWYCASKVLASSYVAEAGVLDAVFSWSFLAYFKTSQRSVFVGSISTQYGINPSPANEITLGSPTGLRGYQAFAFSGQRQVLLNLEQRIFPDLHVWIFKLGGAAFFDCGTAWRSPERLWNQRLHAAVGFGLRIENENRQGLGTIRIDVALNLDKKQIGTITISSEQLFSAFSIVDLPLPNMIH